MPGFHNITKTQLLAPKFFIFFARYMCGAVQRAEQGSEAKQNIENNF